MSSNRNIKYFLLLTALNFPILIFNSCSSSNEENISGGYNSIQSTYYIKQEETSLPMNFNLRENESIYFELCDIEMELINFLDNYPTSGNTLAIIRVYYGYLTNSSIIEYNSSDGKQIYYAENGTNFVFYFNEIILEHDHFELSTTINRYARL